MTSPNPLDQQQTSDAVRRPADPAWKVGPERAVSEELFEELSALALERGCELLHVGRQGSTLQLVLDHPDGVTLEHCSGVSREAGAILDAHDYGRERYVLEVTSPGIERQFYSVGDYQRFVGEPVKVRYRQDGRKATVHAELTAFDRERGEITLTLPSGDVLGVHLRDVLSTRLEIQL